MFKNYLNNKYLLLDNMETKDRLIEGLKEYNLTLDEIMNWKYCGGSEGVHHKYFKLCFPKGNLPELKTECICHHAIKINCYITNGDKHILILGNCCIKKFIPKCSRTCELCQQPHQRRKENICYECKETICIQCKQKLDNKNKRCSTCILTPKCIKCNFKLKDASYPTCYNCKFKTK